MSASLAARASPASASGSVRSVGWIVAASPSDGQFRLRLRQFVRVPRRQMQFGPLQPQGPRHGQPDAGIAARNQRHAASQVEQRIKPWHGYSLC
jgi:hypothetical protein